MIETSRRWVLGAALLALLSVPVATGSGLAGPGDDLGTPFEPGSGSDGPCPMLDGQCVGTPIGEIADGWIGQELDELCDDASNDAGLGDAPHRPDWSAPHPLVLGLHHEGQIDVCRQDPVRWENLVDGDVGDELQGDHAWDLYDWYVFEADAEGAFRVDFLVQTADDLPGAPVRCAVFAADVLARDDPNRAEGRSCDRPVDVPSEKGYVRVRVASDGSGSAHVPRTYTLRVAADGTAASEGTEDDRVLADLTRRVAAVPGEDPGDETARSGPTLGARSAAVPTPPTTGNGPDRVAWLAGAAVGATLAGLLLYRRLSRQDVLDHDVRSAIRDLARERPGIAPARIADELGATLQNVLYHLRILDDQNLVIVDEAGKAKRVFHPDNAGTRRERRIRSIRRSDAKRRLLEAIRDVPGASMAELARRLDRNRSTVKRHVDELVQAGLVAADRDGRTRRLHLADDVRRMLAS